MCSCQRTPPRGWRPRLQPRPIPFGKFVMQVVSRRAARCGVVGVTGVEPVTLRLSSACSNQLSYTPNRSSERVSVRRRSVRVFTLSRYYALTLPRILVELRRLELLTYSLQSYRSTN